MDPRIAAVLGMDPCQLRMRGVGVVVEAGRLRLVPVEEDAMWVQTWRDAPVTGKWILALHNYHGRLHLRAHGPWCSGLGDLELTRANLDKVVDGRTFIEETFLDCVTRRMPEDLRASLRRQQLDEDAALRTEGVAARVAAMSAHPALGAERKAALADADKAAHDARVDSLWRLCEMAMDWWAEQQAAPATTPAA